MFKVHNKVILTSSRGMRICLALSEILVMPSVAVVDLGLIDATVQDGHLLRVS